MFLFLRMVHPTCSFKVAMHCFVVSVLVCFLHFSLNWNPFNVIHFCKSLLLLRTWDVCEFTKVNVSVAKLLLWHQIKFETYVFTDSYDRASLFTFTPTVHICVLFIRFATPFYWLFQKSCNISKILDFWKCALIFKILFLKTLYKVMYMN